MYLETKISPRISGSARIDRERSRRSLESPYPSQRTNAMFLYFSSQTKQCSTCLFQRFNRIIILFTKMNKFYISSIHNNPFINQRNKQSFQSLSRSTNQAAIHSFSSKQERKKREICRKTISYFSFFVFFFFSFDRSPARN